MSVKMNNEITENNYMEEKIKSKIKHPSSLNSS